MEFSVLMSVYENDNPIFFDCALKSISLKQTLKPNQIVIIKDGPCSKKIDEIIMKYSGLLTNIRFNIIENKDNLGLAASLNKGIDVCEYEWIARMDADDIAVSNRFELQIRYLQENPDIDIVGGAISEFLNVPEDIKSDRYLPLIHEEICQFAKHRTPMNHMSVLYRKKEVVNAGKYDTSYGKLEDYKLWVDMIIKGAKFANVKDILIYVRIGNGFINRRSNKKEISDWDKLSDYMNKNGMITSFDKLINKLSIRIFMYMPKPLKKVFYMILRK